MRERWRLAGLVPMLVGGALALYPHRSDMIIAPDGRQVAIRTANGSYQILARKIDPFLAGIWLRADGDSRAAKDPALMAATRCDASGCVAPMPDGRLVALALERDAFADDCRSAVLIVTPIAAPRGCAAEVATIDRDSLAASGAIALDLRPAVPRKTADPPSVNSLIAAATEDDSTVRHRLDDEDVPPLEPGSPQLRAGTPPLDAEFLVTTAFPRIRRPWMPPYAGDDEPETDGAGAQ
jgi:competence protein ComEC